MNALRLQVPVIYKHFQTTFDKLNKATTSYKRINRRSSVIMIIIKSPSKATKSINLDFHPLLRREGALFQGTNERAVSRVAMASDKMAGTDNDYCARIVTTSTALYSLQ